MGWFENQIEERRNADQQLLEDSFIKIAGVILGQRSAQRIGDERIVTKNAIDEILKYYHLKPVEVPENITRAGDQLDYCLRAHGLMHRDVTLTERWYADAYGPMLGRLKEDGTPVALLPNPVRGYYYHDPKTGQRVKLSAGTAASIAPDAICFYRPLPHRRIGVPDLLLYIKRCLSVSDMVLIVAATLAVTLVGMLLPRITKALTGPVLASRQTSALAGIGICIVCVLISSQLFSSIRALLMSRLQTKTTLGVQASMMMRLMSLPAGFFRRFAAGDLKSRAMSVNQLCSVLLGMVLSAVMTFAASLLYISQIYVFARVLVLPSLVIILVTMGFSLATAFAQIRINKKRMELSAKESGMSYAMIAGVQKIRLAGAEKRVFARWLNLFSQGADLTYNPPLFLKLNPVFTAAISLVSTIALYFLAVRGGVDASSYFAFTAAYGAIMGALGSLSGVALSAAQIRPILEMAEPFLSTEPETAENREIVTDISGGITLERVSFRYSEQMPYILDDLSLNINPGEYVAVVGRTGCGKSTLMRLLLGFETPEKGAIFYDGKNLNSLDLSSLRRQIGTVMQSSGLFQGDIYSNIVISAPELSLDDAWEAAEKAGIADDIRAMPMGMHTFITEGSGSVSGGQRQRLMIARAIAPKPKLLLFDEATSALDNKTQRQVSEALDTMGCTRVVIAHRLSTIRHCDRILVLEGGKIIEDGTYDELLAKNGFFAELVERQRLDSTD